MGLVHPELGLEAGSVGALEEAWVSGGAFGPQQALFFCQMLWLASIQYCEVTSELLSEFVALLE